MKHPSLHTLIGHSGVDGGSPQSLYDHLKNVAELASTFARPFGSESIAEWLGWWHDAGKCEAEVQAYLRGETNLQRGPDHSSAGMLEAAEVLAALAFNIAGHHGGLSDACDLRDRISKKRQDERVIRAWEQAGSELKSITVSPKPEQIPDHVSCESTKEHRRRLALWLRLLHSALVDADCLDTEAHFQHDKADLRQDTPSPSMGELFARVERDQAGLISRVQASPVNVARADIYAACLQAAENPPGFFSLTVPTGGGKTRSALAFALKHAAIHRLRRVIVALPYTSIIEQNADVYRALLGDDVVLEHHSAVESRAESGDESETERRMRLLAENWDAPVIVTTNVQLLESLYASRNGKLRKLHRIARSVIVLDEAQTIPPGLLIPTLEILRFLVAHYGCSVVLCTATQPALAHRVEAGYEGLQDVREIVPDPDGVYETLKRVDYEIHHAPGWPWDRVADELRREPQALAILNTVADALAVFDMLEDEDVFHLSTRLCVAHRRRVLAEVGRRLSEGLPIRLISTQVVEAGVDLDFPLVLRALGPLDSMIQAAGRCNREGKRASGRVILFEALEGKLPPGVYRVGADVTRRLIRRYGDGFPNRLHDADLPLEYFSLLYGARNLDENRVLAQTEDLSFRAVSQAYRLIEDDTTPVVVPYRDAGLPDRDRLLERIRHRGHATRADFRSLQPYMVNLRKPDHERAVADRLCREVVPGLWRWIDDLYDGRLNGKGLQWAFQATGLIY